MLSLLTPTDPLWPSVAASNLPALLADHAHCELKAAQSALSLLARFGCEAPELIEPLSALAREETDHFAQVHGQMALREMPLQLPATDGYVNRLSAAARKDHESGTPALLDRLLVAALIEARSCERFRLLAEQLPDLGLRAFYRELMASEARHFTLFSTLAATCFGQDASRARLAVLAAREAEIVRQLPLGPQVHG
jgi:tRNA 2-(methylsulfanyl)-N6-isopentenyladenosine37 hydroxylase